MCGIVGFNWRDDEEIRDLAERIKHRGPDGQGFFVDDAVSLGHSRLAILDTSSAGHQPMFYHADCGAFSDQWCAKSNIPPQVAIVYNGEIYNYPELKSELVSKGYRFNTRCDTECLLAAYLEWGIDCVTHFNGMWSFCIYDMQKRQFFLSRDRLGIKPLYYFEKDGRFAFGSELKAVLAKGIERTVDEQALHHYLMFNYAPVTTSILKGVSKLPPATNLIFDLDSSRIVKEEKFWKPVFTEEPIEEVEAAHKLRYLLQDAVEKRLLSDVPVGAFLSGGVDSSIICALMRPHVDRLKTFSIRFDYPDFNESEHAKAVAEHLKTEHFEINFNANDVRRLIEELPSYFDEPLADASMIPTYLVSSVAASEVKVCLSGTGSDELFGGYSRYHEYLLLRRMLSLPRWVKRAIASVYKVLNSDKGSKLNQLLESTPQTLYLKLFSHLFRGEGGNISCLENLIRSGLVASPGEGLNGLLRFDQTDYLPGNLLVKEDRATMAHHLEGRVPFLDYRLVEFANSLPCQMKLRGREGKHLLKKAFSGIVPPFVLKRKKQGFGVPLKNYFRGELRDYARGILFDSDGSVPWDEMELHRLWQMHQDGSSDYSPLFWNLIMFRKWSEKYLR